MLALVALILLHSVDGREFAINPNLITHMYAPRRDPGSLTVAGVNCIVGLVDGKFISVVETCEDVRRLMEGSR